MRRASRRTFGTADVGLTAVMDLMTILLVFLLESLSADPVQVTPSADLALPISSATAAPRVAVSVVVTQRELVLDGVPLLRLVQREDARGATVAAIPDEAMREGRVEALEARLRERLAGGAPGELLLQCDRRLPYSVIRDVTWTAGQAGFSDFRFVVIKGS